MHSTGKDFINQAIMHIIKYWSRLLFLFHWPTYTCHIGRESFLHLLVLHRYCAVDMRVNSVLEEERLTDPPVISELWLSLEEIYHGCRKKMKISRKVGENVAFSPFLCMQSISNHHRRQIQTSYLTASSPKHCSCWVDSVGSTPAWVMTWISP